ncbi:MAG: 2-C-methyl-D-erythritol 4-phosphate cytidylyltransferase [Bacillota bacterium]|nr:2-C-methyl-D-erythritol 4-phosphate cytidylyltransferase [Bacillota bacterium]
MYKGRTVSVVIAAAGSGRRMGTGSKNKVYIEIGGKTILERTFEAFENNAFVDRIFAAVREEDLDFCRENVLRADRHPKLGGLTAGGTERCISVYKALEKTEDEDIVLIHDGARPFVDDETINLCIEGAAEHGCCAAGVPVKDTIKAVDNGVVSETPDRSRLYAVHTPQAFIAEEIKECMKAGIEEGFYGTDEAVFAEKQGKKVFIVASKYDNIKVTTSDDLIIAEAVLAKRKNRE